ncbi:hypothetical protein IGK38_003041 [Enterococcus pernyi]|uniref:Uncharacterized protein n=1 Tax=Enterococcus mundtii TaxID=53346 RepID=A0A848MV83_ENTMU|nr:hypothetical protein [Enterococcus mundtii]EOH65555.1 hypothetical protein UAC_00481 [Enterococcus mundtii ATCC 882]EOU09362.1 hypothetical protein I587_02972 [Enterococcus mundtii ATCC 882]MCW6016545.1 hypothetical protein [Serratia marcescens]NMP59877.1 hypothetical protein [Enterococcus mundtii]
MSIEKNEGIGLNAITRKNKTQRPENIIPENSEALNNTTNSGSVLEQPKKRLTAKDLPKSVRMPVDTHTAISTIATIEDKKIYETLNKIVEFYIDNMNPANKKIVKNSVKAVQNIYKENDK